MSQNRVLHIVSDEKFIDSAFNDFEKCGFFKNYFLIVGKKKKLKYIKHAKIYFLNTYVLFYFMPLLSLFFSLIVFHSIRNNFDKKLILKVSRQTKIHWISWGFDLVGLIYNKRNLLSIKTSELINSNYNYLDNFPELEKNFEWLNRVDIISTVLPNEYELLKKNFSFKTDKYLKWNYSSLGDLIPNDFHFNNSGNDIMLGHCGSPYLNHLDLFPILKSKFNEYNSLVLPLSYGNEKYIKNISKLASIEFNDKLICLNTFLPYSDYLKILSNCKLLIVPALRQIGLFNILLFFYFGKPVYLNAKSPTYIFFKEHDFPVFDINNFRNYKSNDFINVDLGLIRSKLELIWGEEVKNESMLKLFQYLD